MKSLGQSSVSRTSRRMVSLRRSLRPRIEPGTNVDLQALLRARAECNGRPGVSKAAPVARRTEEGGKLAAHRPAWRGARLQRPSEGSRQGTRANACGLPARAARGYSRGERPGLVLVRRSRRIQPVHGLAAERSPPLSATFVPVKGPGAGFLPSFGIWSI